MDVNDLTFKLFIIIDHIVYACCEAGQLQFSFWSGQIFMFFCASLFAILSFNCNTGGGTMGRTMIMINKISIAFFSFNQAKIGLDH